MIGKWEGGEGSERELCKIAGTREEQGVMYGMASRLAGRLGFVCFHLGRKGGKETRCMDLDRPVSSLPAYLSGLVWSGLEAFAAVAVSFFVTRTDGLVDGRMVGRSGCI